MRVFVYGELRDADVRRVVTGRDVPAMPATLPGHAVVRAGDAPVLRAAPGGPGAEGALVELSGAALDRVDFYERSLGRAPHPVEVAGAPARAYLAEAASEAAGAPWRPEAWRPVWGRIAREAAREIMEYRGRLAPAEVSRRMGPILSRADAAARAATEGPPQAQRRGFTSADVEVVRHRRPYSEFFSVVEQDLRFRRFDGGWSDTVTRAAMVASDAVTVLPYDPVRDTVLLVEQFRYGPHARGDRAPWALEPIAGRVDPGEGPEATARREAVEEAQLEIGRLEKVGAYYASTGCLSEYVISYVGLCDLGSFGGNVSGAAEENEDILSHVVSFERLMQLVASGEAEDAPLLVSAYWLAANRERLKAGAP